MAKTSKFLQQQKLAVGVFGVLLLTIVGYLTWVTVSGPGTGELVEGESYELIENPRRIRGDKIEVMEFFSYGCVHCYNFDEELHEWVESQGDRVNFVRMPAIANDQWRLLGQHYYTMEALDVIDEMHTPTFRVIHEGRRILNSEDDLAAL